MHRTCPLSSTGRSLSFRTRKKIEAAARTFLARVVEQSGIGLPKKAFWFLVFNVRSLALSVEPFAKMRLSMSPPASQQSLSSCDKQLGDVSEDGQFLITN